MASECSKVRYRDRIAALLAMARTGRHSRRPKDERRAYYCTSCRAWHLTSQH